MVDANKKVIGSYATKEEVFDVVDRLNKEGHPKQNIILYSNKETASTLGHHDAVEIVADKSDATRPDDTDKNDDRSMWDKIKDAFTSDTYDYKDEHTRDDYDQGTDILYPYRDDIAKGNVVVVVDNYEGRSTEETATAGNTSAMPSDVGHSEDPGNTSAMPSDVGRSAEPENDPLTKGREFSREDETNDGYKK
ncbi:general stress protein [Alkalibacterium sp. 20]|uniref:general stress protein n=1 Tax=Alkalibacterium sp. 20 TaxID=1798803 RepID=UPI0009004424|nr:general stress protein [Alkalibacterium sp. 20]OJF90964.1 hypothetical protein AX762_04110 [Alkalibacterium sp. 20]